MQLCQIVQELEFKILSGDESQQLDVTCAYISDILSDVMAKAAKGSLWITNQTHMNVIAICFFKTLAGVILPDGLQPDEAVMAKALEKNIVVISTPLSAFDVAGKLYALGLRGE
jgi:hypothetical protein